MCFHVFKGICSSVSSQNENLRRYIVSDIKILQHAKLVMVVRVHPGEGPKGKVMIRDTPATSIIGY